MGLSENDERVLEFMRHMPSDWDGWAPHGQRDWVAVGRLLAANLIEHAGVGVCMDCDSATHRRDPTDVDLFRLVRSGAEGGE